MNALTILEIAEQLVSMAAQLVPSIEADIAAAKNGLSSTDAAAAQEQINSLHAQSQALTDQLDALKSA